MVKQTQSKENNKVKQTQQITDGSKPTDSQKKKKKTKTKTQYIEIRNQRTTQPNTNRCWKKERNLT